jgi:hypothetical protein
MAKLVGGFGFSAGFAAVHPAGTVLVTISARGMRQGWAFSGILNGGNRAGLPAAGSDPKLGVIPAPVRKLA